MPQLQRQEADFGVCIHEGRFTFEEQGLACVEDLGQVWEEATGSPLPLGGILARHQLGERRLGDVQRLVKRSIQYGLAHRDRTLPTIRKYAQEFDDEVIFAHIDLYVNEWTVNLGSVGRDSLQQLDKRAKQVGLVPSDQSPLLVFAG